MIWGSLPATGWRWRHGSLPERHICSSWALTLSEPAGPRWSTWSFMLNLLFQTDFLRRCSLWFSFSLSRLTSTCLLVNTRSCSFSLMLSSWKEKNCIFILLYIKALILKESNTSCWNPTGDYCEVNWWSEAAYLQLGGVGDTALF